MSNCNVNKSALSLIFILSRWRLECLYQDEGIDTLVSLVRTGKVDPNWVIKRAERYLEAGADMIMIDADGLISSLDNLRSDLVAKLIERLGVEKIMFEANDPTVSEWFITNYGPKVSCSSLLLVYMHASKLHG